MSILKVNLSEINTQNDFKVKQTVFINMFLVTILMLSTLDLLVASFRGDSLTIYTKFVFSDLILTVLGLIFCSDLIIQKGRKLFSYYFSYMIFLWSCLTIIKLVYLA